MDMKNLKYLIIALMISPLFFINTGCGTDEVPPLPPPEDTVAVDTPACGFTVSFQNYQLVLDGNLSQASYRKDINETLVNIVGYSEKGNAGASITSKAELELTFIGQDIGVYTQNSPGFSLEVATGEGSKRIESSTDFANAMAVTISEYGEVGELIKCTFTGELKSGINSRSFSKGFFEIERDADR
ncbi:MAG: hypothetical protein ACI8SE_001620 [Bacteroidia bacterium]|jgi:hypothetical protein